VLRQRDAERLRLADGVACLLREGVDGVLGRVGGEALGVVAGVVHVVEVADQRDAHVVVGDLVRLGVAEDAHDAGLGFSVLVVAQRDGHRSLLGSWVVSRRAGSAVAGG
jgi:hypothetical protein